MRSPLRSLLGFASFCLVALALPLTGHAAATTVVDTIGNPASTLLDVIQKQGIATAFTTDAQTYRLDDVVTQLVLPGTDPETVEIQLRANNDAKNQPGAILEKWTEVSVANGSAQNIVSQSVTHAVLTPNTQYWLVVRAISGGQVNWPAETATTHTGAGTIGAVLAANNAQAANPSWKVPGTFTGTLLFAVEGTPEPPALIASVGSAGTPQVKTFDPATVNLTGNFFAFDPAFTGGVRVAAADFDGDGLPEILAGAGPGGGSQVKLFRGSDGTVLEDFFAFAPTFTGGVYVAAGDVNGDGYPDIIAGAGSGGGPQVKVFSGKNGAALKSFFAFDSSFTGGVRVAAADFDGDGCADIVTGAGPGGGPQVKVFSGKTGQVMYSFFGYTPGFSGGIFVAAGDVYGDGHPAIIVGPDAGSSGARVNIYGGPGLTGFQSFQAFDQSFTGGVRVAVGDLDGDGVAQLIVGAGPGSGAHLKTFEVPTSTVQKSFDAFSNTFTGGIFVAGATLPQRATLSIAAAGVGAGKVTGKFIPPLMHTGGMANDSVTVTQYLTESFDLVATPGKGAAFSGWTDGLGQIVSYEKKATFRMAAGLTLQANFVPAPFAGFDGTYDDVLVFDGTDRGFFTAKVGESGSLAVKMKIPTPTGLKDVTIPSAQLLGTGDYQRMVRVEGLGNLRLTLALNLNPLNPFQITGSLEQVLPPGDSSTPLTISFTAKREDFADGDCPYAGSYTLLLTRPNGALADFPAGIGAVLVNVSDKGKATFKGALGDGSRLVASFPLAQDGSCAFYFPLYQKQGYLAGILSFSDKTDSDIDGTLTWVKPTGVRGIVNPGGFSGDVTALGTAYAPTAGARLILGPNNGVGTLKLTIPDGAVVISGQIVDAPPINAQEPVTLDTDDFLHLPDDALALTGKFTRKTGLFQGSFADRIGNKNYTFKFIGVTLQAKGATVGQVGGYFIRGDHAGAVSITP